jgi:hypothetical protein
VANRALRRGAQRIDGDGLVGPVEPHAQDVGQGVAAADAVEEGRDVRRLIVSSWVR